MSLPPSGRNIVSRSRISRRSAITRCQPLIHTRTFLVRTDPTACQRGNLFENLFSRRLVEARGLLRAVLVGRFVFTPVTPPPALPPRKGPGRKPRSIYELRGEATLSGLIAGLISASSVVAPTGRDRTCRIEVRDFIAR